jgi:oligoendopeptidase F
MSNYLQEKFENPEEKLSVLELRLQSDTQVIIDILSRFIFESKVMSEANRPISKHEMKAWMLDAQKEAYGEGLDPNYLHPYMWLVKGHYYSAGLNFYNFPYAFGLLFGKGLYAQYLKDKTKFIEKYDELLKLTTKEDAEVVAQSMGIDITQKSFWIDSLEMIRKDIEEVIKLL